MPSSSRLRSKTSDKSLPDETVPINTLIDAKSPTKRKTRSKKKNTSSEDIVDEEWISATSTYNYMMKDPFLDWLKHHHGSLSHRHRTYRKVVNRCVKDSKSKYNFTSYIMEQGHIFEDKVMKIILKKFGPERIAEIHGELGPRDPKRVEATLNAMKKGIPFIHSGVIHNHQNKTFGIPDLLVRGDWLKFLVKELPLTKKEETISAPLLGSRYHYRVVDIKFTSLLLRADGIHLLNAGSFPAYKSQLLIYNEAIGQMQGYTPPQAYILGRRWKYTAKGETYIGDTCFDKLGVIDYQTCDNDYVRLTRKALKWLRAVRSNEAADWNILKYPLHRWELYPNMCNGHDYPWHAVKEEIATKTKELTLLWMVGPKNRTHALGEGISQWTDDECCAEVLGITGEKTGKILDSIIRINQDPNATISPAVIQNNIGSWKKSDTIEFFVDFETTNGAISSIKRLPVASTEAMVFMIGVGYVDPYTKEWIYKDFTVNRLTFKEEERICRKFADYIRFVSQEHGVKQPRCIHWAPAEDIFWTDAVERHDPISEEWKSWSWDWLDLLLVFKEEPIVINGCMSFSLKDVARAMKEHGMIESGWNKSSVCVDGQSAMIAARKADIAAREAGISMKKVPVMQEIIRYNEVDVKVLYEIITYLRENHVSTRKRSVRTSKRESSIIEQMTDSTNEIPKSSKMIPGACETAGDKQSLSLEETSFLLPKSYNLRKRPRHQ
jgi:hypothetical protein